MIKKDIIERVSDASRGQISRREAATLVDQTLEIVKSTLASGEDVMVSSFGVFKVADKAERPGRNPWTGALLTIEPRKIVRFKTSTVLRRAMSKPD